MKKRIVLIEYQPYKELGEYVWNFNLFVDGAWSDEPCEGVFQIGVTDWDTATRFCDMVDALNPKKGLRRNVPTVDEIKNAWNIFNNNMKYI